MYVSTRRLTRLGGVAVLLPFALAGCGLLGRAAKPGPPPEDVAAKSRERVQAYLDAMKAKNSAAGRAQLCPVLQPSFDQAATGPNGDFATHFTVQQAMITDVHPNGGRQEVSATVTVNAQRTPINLLFVLTKSGDQWCIAAEKPGGNAAPSAEASPEPSS